jgi:hypothetical protein
MNREEHVGVLAIGDLGSFLERHVDVRPSREDDIDALVSLQELFQPQRDVEHQRGFVQPLPKHAGIVTAMARIDHDARYAQPELARDREAAHTVCRRC